jgi:hypothetical protein
MNICLRAAVAPVIVAVVALAPAGAASADNSNSNTNNNDVTDVDGSDTSGSSSDENTDWPPTDLGWPPKDVMNADNGETGSNKNNNDRSATTPIVTPLGQPGPTDTATPSTPETTKPIVPVSSP